MKKIRPGSAMFETYFRSSPITYNHVTIVYNCSVKQDNFDLNVVILRAFIRTSIHDSFKNSGGSNEYQQFMLRAKVCNLLK